MAVSIYMLRCRDGSYYVGSANDLERRLSEHQTGAYGGYTSTRRPIELVWSQAFEHAADAVSAERKIKGWSRAKKEALIRGDWTLIRNLSRRRAGKRKSSSFEARLWRAPQDDGSGLVRAAFTSPRIARRRRA